MVDTTEQRASKTVPDASMVWPNTDGGVTNSFMRWSKTMGKKLMRLSALALATSRMRLRTSRSQVSAPEIRRDATNVPDSRWLHNCTKCSKCES